MAILTTNNELLINESHNNKYIFVLERIPTAYLLSKYANTDAEQCFRLNMEPEDLSFDIIKEQNQDLKNFLLYVQTIDIPNIDVGYSTNATQFVDIPHVQGKLNFGELEMTIMNDEDWFIWRMLYYWFLAAFNPEERMKFKEKEYYRQFYVTGHLIVLNNHLEKCIELEFTDLHPVAIGSIPMTEKDAEKIILPVTWIHTGFVESDRYVIKRV